MSWQKKTKNNARYYYTRNSKSWIEHRHTMEKMSRKQKKTYWRRRNRKAAKSKNITLEK